MQKPPVTSRVRDFLYCVPPRDWFVDGFGVTEPRWSVRFLKKDFLFFFGSFWKILIENYIDWNFIMDKLKPWLTKWLAILLIITAVGESGALKVSVLQLIGLKFVM